MNSFQCTMLVTILAIEIMNHKTPAHPVSTLFNKPSGQIYQLLKVIGLYHTWYLMGHGSKDVQVLHQVSADKAIATQITGAALALPWRE